MTVENCMQDAILTAMDRVVMPRIEISVRTITDSSGHGTSRVVKNPNRGDFTGNAENTPLLWVPSRLNLNIDQDHIDETRDIENFENGHLPALKPNSDGRAQAHHSSVGCHRCSKRTSSLLFTEKREKIRPGLTPEIFSADQLCFRLLFKLRLNAVLYLNVFEQRWFKAERC